MGEKVFGKSKTICLCVPSFSGGGAEKAIVTLANSFFDLGYKIDLIVKADVGPYKDDLNPQIRKIALCNINSVKLIEWLIAFFCLWRYFTLNRDIVALSTLREFNVFVIIAFCLSRSKAHLFIREADTLDGIMTKEFIKRLLLKSMRQLYPKVSAVIANSEATRNDLLLKLPLQQEKVITIYNPLRLEFIYSMTKSINKNIKPTIIACGRLVEKKNFIELVHVMPKIIKQFPEAKLIVLGEGPKKEELQSAIKRLSLEKSIELVGFKNNPYSYFAAAHVFVQTSLWEGFGYVLAEALACGTPVVAYDSKGAMKEILENGRYGILVPPGNKEALVKSIIKQIEKPRNSDFYRKAVLRFEVNKITFDYLKVLGMTN